ncbi:hypothetical protein [Rhizobium sp. FKL33]|uniref:hypothetical protein n=1 Tax=Rhizobium sp. FKL33 TaxID=2562307 RepID=UPI0010C11767|nr:hypothetical protein [Rhizobium sp. FKL33]
MEKTRPVAKVFVDTNILKFSAVKKHVYRKKKTTINWGGAEFQADIYEPHTVNDLQKIKNEVQRRDALFLCMLAYAGISELLNFYFHRAVDLEAWGLPGMASPSGRFFGCPVHDVPDPHPPRSRIISGGNKEPKEHSLDFISSIKHPRFVELMKMTGAYQGKNRPLNLNQALDAYHIWCAESANIDYFLTMDYSLKRVVEHSKTETSVKIVTPDQLIRIIIPKLGFLKAINFIWNGYKFSKSRVAFGEGKGWI